MWILPSRGRPQNIKRLIDAYKETGATTPVWLRLDMDDPLIHGYFMDMPKTWLMEIGERKPLSGYYNELYERTTYDWYGFIADDVVPETPLWDRKLISVAGLDGMAVPSGGHHPDIPPHFVLGGDLVRSVGFLCLPGLDRLYIDTTWRDIAVKRGVLRNCPEVVLKHQHFSIGAPYDATYKKHHKEEDKTIYETYRSQL